MIYTPYDMIYTLMKERTEQTQDSPFKNFDFAFLPVDSYGTAQIVTGIFSLYVEKEYFVFSSERSESNPKQGIIKIIHRQTNPDLITRIEKSLTFSQSKLPTLVPWQNFPHTMMVH